MGDRRGQRAPQVKNKSAAEIQITAEQIIREAQERQEEEIQPPKQKITDKEELDEYRLRKRKEFEDQIRRQRGLITNWLKYAAWEDSQGEMERARNVYERALDVEYRNVTIWLKYAEMEMKHKNVNLARNLWDRAVTLLPRVSQFWYKYIYMEDILGNYANARQIFERWMEWQPDEQAWNSYVKFEMRQRRGGARAVGLPTSNPTVKTWVRWARFEEKLGEVARSREVYEKAIDYLGDLANDELLFIAFAEFEERAREYDRARAIYKYALDHIPKARADDLYRMFITFEKQHGQRSDIEDVIVGKRRFQYEEELKTNTHNYDIWFDYVRLEEINSPAERVRDIYERAIANVPPAADKRFWRRYIYLWINYALYEELQANDAGRAREVYKQLLRIIPHQSFSFSKAWTMAAQFEIRQLDLAGARSVLGHGIGMAPKEKVFKFYIQLELQLGNVDRCRRLYEAYVERHPDKCSAWTSYAELERQLGEVERARAIYDLAVEQPLLDMPEVLWKAYIDFEIEQEEAERTELLYRRLLERTKHVKVWISYAQFLATIAGRADDARTTYEDAYKYLKNAGLKEERVLLVQSWKQFEEQAADEKGLARVNALLPKRIKKRRPIKTDDGTAAGWEEYYDYIFPDEQAALPNLRILQKAHQWKAAESSS
ncbi:cell cycle control protein [Acanthamoeba castellanii str. Neff]|uniref:Cell cycle control protein n=1 Tax=Acanthamoeba castellanii (strain ATCC 30010 / Neff) TaxID=1257118 RepID=L8H5V0_ACACF|nr:cell cycle control protein [Acanthamoeba castellanii str. Neff]ELR20088.1 cell cycle control protein [Acanthamoeba castellanii str. Neff]